MEHISGSVRKNKNGSEGDFLPRAQSNVSIGTALDLPKDQVPKEDSLGRIASGFVYLYPPGIPLLAPGEVITEEILEQIHVWEQNGMEVQGLEEKGYLNVLKFR